MEKHNANECPDCGGRVTKFVEHGLFGEERVRWVCVKCKAVVSQQGIWPGAKSELNDNGKDEAM